MKIQGGEIMKKVLALILACVMLFGVFAACGNTNSGNQGGNQGGSAPLSPPLPTKSPRNI